MPEHSCSYCGVHEEGSVVKCIDTGKWFCTSTSNTAPTSHILHHLIQTRSSQIHLHPSSPLSSSPLICYHCSARNIFTLGFVPAREESTVVLLCRNCCDVKEMKEMSWDVKSWTSLIHDRKLLTWLAPMPSEMAVVRAREITQNDIRALEAAWKKNPAATLDDLGEEDEDDDIEPLSLKYDDGYHYQNLLAPLVKLEADCDKESKSNLGQVNVSIEWGKSINNRWQVTFSNNQHSNKLMVGDEMSIELDRGGEFLNGGRAFTGRGYIKVISDDAIVLELQTTTSSIPSSITTNYNLDFIWKSVSFDRMQTSLKTFAVDDSSVSGYIYHKILGHAVEEQIIERDLQSNLSAPGLVGLNAKQDEIIRKALTTPFSLIQGPPGTGKTVTSATLIFWLAKFNKNQQILVTAPSNIAVDSLASKISSTGVKVVRVCSKTREESGGTGEEVTLHRMVDELGGPTLKKLKDLKNEMGELKTADEQRLRGLVRKLEKKILSTASVICTTCVNAADARIKNLTFETVIIDEATQAIEPESLIPLTMGCKHLTIIGDHLQLPPVVVSKPAMKAGLGRSMFERLVMAGLRPLRLDVQYRMHPGICEFPSNMFYGGSLSNGVSEADRENNDAFPFPSPRPIAFYNVPAGIEELSPSGTSYLNRAESATIEKVVTHLLSGGIKAENIGVITPYDGQRTYLTDYLKRSGSLMAERYEGVEIASVDSFQGREKDYILISCVRSSESSGIGFLADPRRLNVAITRAKLGLIIAGNARVLCKNVLWGAFLLEFRDCESLVEGSISDLRPVPLIIPKPRQSGKDAERYYATALVRGGWKGRWDDRGGGKGRRVKRGNKDSRHDKRYQQGGLERIDDEESLGFAPLPDFDGGFDYGDEGDDDSTIASQSSRYEAARSEATSCESDKYGRNSSTLEVLVYTLKPLLSLRNSYP
ncbi:hypothetical protein TL16_g12291 [Triparma laevis f. inornata]|uniref:Upf1 domain-containing protein n=1 Tax=Triparma laevis f. inornata TaxID=1714386 RepID=A0A9W7BQJ7_9STRA|nr:hypothetical protein TL16_g12291 [Triparma laevis f. inornata]